MQIPWLFSDLQSLVYRAALALAAYSSVIEAHGMTIVATVNIK